MNDTFLHVVLAVGTGLISAVFTAGVIYTWVKMSIGHLEESANRIHRDLDDKINKNFETQDERIKENEMSCKADLGGIGGKVSRNERDALRRYHNLTTAMMLAVPPDKESQVSGLLKEEG